MPLHTRKHTTTTELKKRDRQRRIDLRRQATTHLEQAALLRRDFITLALRIDVEKLPPELRSLREEMEIHREEAARAADEAKNMKPSKFRRRKIGAGSDRVWGNAQMRALLRRQPPTE